MTLPFSNVRQPFRFIVVVMLFLGSTVAGRGQNLIVVNGDPISEGDITQRTKLTEVSGRKKPSRAEIIEELITEKVKTQALRRYPVPNLDQELNTALSTMAGRINLTPAQLIASLAKRGVGFETLKARLVAEIAWTRFIESRYKVNLSLTDRDVETRLKASHPEAAVAIDYEYTLQPILFLLPPNSSTTAFEEKGKLALVLKTRFHDCVTGAALARGMVDVAVKPLLTKPSAEFNSTFRDILEKTELGHLTPPIRTEEGVEVYGVCARGRSDDTTTKRAVKGQMYNEIFQGLSKRILKEMRDQALVEYR